MIEDFQGKIINDDDVSLPKMEDYYYNSLCPILDLEKVTADSQFYIENPPDGEDAVGLSADGTMFIINSGPGYNVKNDKAAFNPPSLSIYTGVNGPYALTLDTSKCDVGNNAQNREYLNQLSNLESYKNYLRKRVNEKDVINQNDIKLRLLYTDGPQLPRYTTELLRNNRVKKVKFKDIKIAGIHAQPFQAEFDRNGGTLSLDIEPAIREYTDDDDIYVYDNVVQVWPQEESSSDFGEVKKDSKNIGYLEADKEKKELSDDPSIEEHQAYYKDYVTKTTNDINLEEYDGFFFRRFSELDSLGRCGQMTVCISKNNDAVKAEDGDRDTIATVKPKGWHSYVFKSIANGKNKSGNLYNRTHLLTYSLSGESDNHKNLVTTTSSCNQAMNAFVERPVEEWQKTHPDTKFIYRITPIYDGDNLLPTTIKMEVKSFDGSLDLAYTVKNLEKGIHIYYKTGEAWEEGETLDTTYGKYYVMNTNRAKIETINFALRLRNEILNKVLDAKDSRVVISTNGLNRRSDYKAPYATDFTEPDSRLTQAFKDAYETVRDRLMEDEVWYKFSGFNVYGLDAYGKSLAVVYLKTNEKGQERWINLNKYVIYKIYTSEIVKQSDFIPDNLDFANYYKDPTGERFKSWTYDIENINYQDNFWTQLEQKYGQDARRRKIQQEVFKAAGIHPNINNDYKINDKTQYNCLKDWTISIGDVTFFCPPTAISIMTQTATERTPVLRAKGSMAKGIEKADSGIQLSLFFNNEYGINGQKWKGPLWENKDKDVSPLKKAVSDEEAEYDMDGLRALIAEFKFTPFLPVVNTYLNRTLKIAAVSLEQLDIETVPNFPKLIKATLTLKAFDYQVYMPEVPDMYVPSSNDENNEVENPFAQCINYDVMRYYYQKPLQYGNKLAAKLNDVNQLYSFNSIEFIKDTVIQNKTALMPCQFVDPNIDIYMANEDHLKKLLQIKKDSINRMKSGAQDNWVPTAAQSRFLSNIKTIWPVVKPIIDKYNNIKKLLVTEIEKKWTPLNRGFSIKLSDYNFTFEVESGGSVNDEVSKQLSVAAYNEIKKALASQNDYATIVRSIKELDSSEVIGNFRSGWFEIVLQETSSEKNDLETMWDQFRKESTNTKEEYGDLVDSIYPEDLVSSGRIVIGINNVMDIFWNGQIIEATTGLNYFNKDTLLNNSGTKVTYYDSADDALNFITWCAANAENYLDTNKEASELKESIDWENAKTIKYDLVAENVRVDMFQSSMVNNFARVSLLESAGYAPQYMGASDIHIVWKIRTKDEELAMIMKQLPEFEAYCMRKYHLVLPCFPIRIDSEFTRMLGVFEVSIEHTIVNTVPNFPGLYDIEVRAISVDRTLRNREALKSIDNKTDNNKNGQSGELDNKGLVSASTVTASKIRTFSQLDDKMAQAEVYPDLELPTIGELGKKGFIFVRYKDKARDKEDLFVDPDFYYYYPFSTSADIIRSVIQANFNNNTLKNNNSLEDKTTVYSDNNGNSGINFTSKDGRVNFKDANDHYQQIVNQIVKDRKAKTESERDLEALDLSKEYTAALMGDPGKWDISTKITAAFTENFYLGLKNANDKSLDKIVNDKGEKDTQRIAKLKELKEFYTNKFSTIKETLAKLNEKLKTTAVNPANTEIYRYSEYLDPLGINGTTTSQGIDSYDNFMDAVYAANTAMYEYNETVSASQWHGRHGYNGWYKEDNGTITKADLNTSTDKLKALGPFEITKYSYSEINAYLSEEERKELREFCDKQPKEKVLSNELIFTLDPYYRYQSADVQKDYFEKCRKDFNFARAAFTRIVLWWLIKLYENDIFPNIGLDIMGKEAGKQVEANDRAKKLIETIYGHSILGITTELVKNVTGFVERNKVALGSGKIFVATMFALYAQPLKDNPFYAMIDKRDYDGLNEKLKELVSEKYKLRKKTDSGDSKFRKFLLALCGLKEIKSPAYIGRSREVSPASRYITNHNTKLALEAATDPAKYIFHSFYDMVRNDYRGRMLRAFPTFYCIFMDEGKEIGLWKLHDNFYSINSIVDISIVKSRKIAADTCTLTLTNNYQTFTTDDEDGYINYKDASFSELWDSIFHQKKLADEAELRRLSATKINKAKLQPGIRIHVREGYGSDARQLAGIFNGVITEVQPNATVIQIAAQGNGIELMNPIMEDRDADEIQYKDMPGDAINNTEGGGATPDTILRSLLTIKGGALKRYMQGKYSNNQWLYQDGVADQSEASIFPSAWEKYIADVWNKNAYGVVHFGDPDYEDTFPGGEIIQNIYEISAFPGMARDDLVLKADAVQEKEPPYISFEPRGKTVWDAMHICQSVAPDYLVGTASFGMRDTIFFGKPHYYYAYEYQKHNGIWVERRKPYQQYHILYSDKDIIVNNITASSDRIKTVATGLYKDKAGWVDRNKDVGPLWVDKDMYPESQKSMVVDTRLKMKDCNPLLLRASKAGNWFGIENFVGAGIVNFAMNSAQSVANLVGGLVGTITSVAAEDLYAGQFLGTDKGLLGSSGSHKKIAWASTANALKESVKEMYQGEILIIGSPAIKPNDRLLIQDNYNDMSGPVLVRDVVHSLNAETGFTTAMHVDAISVVDDPTEKVKQESTRYIWSQVILHAGMDVALIWSANRGTSILKKIGGEYGEKAKKWGTKAFKTEAIKEAANKTKTSVGKIAKGMSELVKNSSKLKTVAKVGLGIAGGVAVIGLGPAAAATAVAYYIGRAVVADMITQAIVGGINDYFLNLVKDQQVLQIYPLKKNGMVYTAGLDGNIGLVYGSPTYGDFGPLEKAFNQIFAPSKEDDGSSLIGNTMGDILRNIFVSPELQAQAAKFNRDYSYAQRIGDNPNGDEIAIESVSIGTAEKSAFNFHKKNSFDLSLGNRTVVKNKDPEEYRALKNGLKRYYIENIDSLLSSSSRKNQLLISQYQELKPYTRIKFLEVLHDNLDNAKNTNYTKIDTVISNEKVEINGIKVANNVIDVPFLTKDSLVVLKDICDYCFKSLDIDNIKDNTNTNEKLNGTKIVVKSALRVGDENMLCSSGYSFALEGTGKLSNGVLLTRINELRKTLSEKLQSVTGDSKSEVCWYVNNKGNEIRIRVMPESQLTTKDKKAEEDKKKKEASANK